MPKVLEPRIIRLHAKPGAVARQDFTVDVRALPSGTALVATIDGSSAIALDEFVTSAIAAAGEAQGTTVTSPVAGAHRPEEPPGAVEAQLTVVAAAGAGEPLVVAPDQLVSGHVRAEIGAGVPPGMRTAVLRIAGPWPEPAEAEIRFMAGDLVIEPLYPPPVLRQDQWTVIPLRVSLPDALGTEISLTADAPASETGRPTLVMPHNAAVTTSLRLMAPASSFPVGPGRLWLNVSGLAQSPVRYPLDVQIEPPAPPHEPVAEELNPALADAIANALAPVIVRFVGFHCLWESTEASSSDEPYFIVTCLPVDVEKRMTFQTQIFEEVDRGDTRREITELYRGRSAGMVLSVIAREHDTGDPNEYRRAVDAAVDKAADKASEGAAALLSQVPVVGPALAILAEITIAVLKVDLAEELNSLIGSDDDAVGESVLALTPQQLREMARTPHSDFWGLHAHIATKVMTSHRQGGYIALFEVVPG